MTGLDHAHAAMVAAPEDDAARLHYYRVLCDTVLFLWLEVEPQGDSLTPHSLDVDDGPLALAFDSEERLADAAGRPVPYAALPGRVVAQALVGQGVALGINLGVAESAFLLPPAALDWLAATLTHAPVAASARPETFVAPGTLPSALMAGLQAKLGGMSGLASGALLAAVRYAGGRRGHMLAFVDAQSAAEPALARAVAEALTFSGIETGEIDVAFLTADDPVTAAMSRVATRLDMTPQARAVIAPEPGPSRPPRLR